MKGPRWPTAYPRHGPAEEHPHRRLGDGDTRSPVLACMQVRRQAGRQVDIHCPRYWAVYLRHSPAEEHPHRRLGHRRGRRHRLRLRRRRRRRGGSSSSGRGGGRGGRAAAGGSAPAGSAGGSGCGGSGAGARGRGGGRLGALIGLAENDRELGPAKRRPVRRLRTSPGRGLSVLLCSPKCAARASSVLSEARMENACEREPSGRVIPCCVWGRSLGNEDAFALRNSRERT